MVRRSNFFTMILILIVLICIVAVLYLNFMKDDSTPAAKISDEIVAAEPVNENTKDLESLLGIDKNAWNLLLVNSDNPLPDNFEIELATIANGYEIDSRILEPLTDFLNAGNAEGLSIYVTSSYRTVSYQEGVFDRSLKRRIDSGMDYTEALAETETYVAYPGTSEHHTGLAVDIICNQYTNLDSGFANTDAGKWLAANCAEYGFILRFPEDKVDITGISYEPWHFRYVGVEAATYIMENNICLEEFWDLLEGK